MKEERVQYLLDFGLFSGPAIINPWIDYLEEREYNPSFDQEGDSAGILSLDRVLDKTDYLAISLSPHTKNIELINDKEKITEPQ